MRLTQFQLKEEYVCGNKHCTSKIKPHHCKNNTYLQLDFLLKSTSSLLIKRYILLVFYYNPHDWFDFIFKEVHVNGPKDITVKKLSPEFHSFFTEIADICEEKHVIHTSNYLGEEPLTKHMFPLIQEFRGRFSF